MFGSLENWAIANAYPEPKQGHLEAFLPHSLNNLATQRHGRGWRPGDWTSNQAPSVSKPATAAEKAALSLLVFLLNRPFVAIPGLNHCTGTTTVFIRKADIRVRFALSAHQISN